MQTNKKETKIGLVLEGGSMRGMYTFKQYMIWESEIARNR